MRENFSEQPSFREKLKNWSRVGIAGALLFYGGLTEQYRAAAQGRAMLRPVAERSDEGPKETSVEDVRAGLLTDKTERSFYRIGHNRPDSLRALGTTTETNGFIPDSEVDQIVADNPGAKEIEVLHTHPIESYKIVLPDQAIADVQNHRAEAVPMPPSFLDYLALAHLDERYKGISFKGEIIAMNGKFTYTVDIHSKLFQGMRTMRVEGERLLSSLSDSEQDIISQVLAQGVDRRLIVSNLMGTSEGEPHYKEKIALGKKLSHAMEQLSEKYTAIDEAATRIEELDAQIVQTNPADKPKVQGLIAELQELCKQNGIILEYKPL